RDHGKITADRPNSAMEHDKADQLPQLRAAMPRVELRHIVRADEKEEFVVRRAATGFFNRVDCEGRRWPLEFKLINREVRLAFNRSFDHLETRGRFSRRDVQFVRRNRSGHKNEPIKLEFFERFACENQVRVMDRIKRTAVDADLRHRASLVTRRRAATKERWNGRGDALSSG